MIKRVHIVVSAPLDQHAYFHRDAERLREVLELAHLQVETCAVPEMADAIIFVGSSDPALVDVRRHPLFRKHARKCFVFHSGDEPIPTVPGIYASVPRRWYDARRHRAGFYLRATLDGSISDVAGRPARFLFSFVGALGNHPVRERLGALRCEDALIVDSTHAPLPPAQARERFVRSIEESLFVLCPRGGGTSSFRIFETMQAGRVPVIISDDWMAPSGMDWPGFSVRIPEAEIDEIPGRLAALRSTALEMGALARATWEQWFAPERAGATVLAWLEDIQREVDATGSRGVPARMRPSYALRAARHWVDRLRAAIAS